MTEKELLYMEDAIGHEKNIIKILEDAVTKLQDNILKDYMNQQIKIHQRHEKELKKEWEVILNE